jgi:hypothetical protein
MVKDGEVRMVTSLTSIKVNLEKMDGEEETIGITTGARNTIARETASKWRQIRALTPSRIPRECGAHFSLQRMNTACRNYQIVKWKSSMGRFL